MRTKTRSLRSRLAGIGVLVVGTLLATASPASAASWSTYADYPPGEMPAHFYVYTASVAHIYGNRMYSYGASTPLNISIFYINSAGSRVNSIYGSGFVQTTIASPSPARAACANEEGVPAYPQCDWYR